MLAAAAAMPAMTISSTKRPRTAATTTICLLTASHACGARAVPRPRGRGHGQYQGLGGGGGGTGSTKAAGAGAGATAQAKPGGLVLLTGGLLGRRPTSTAGRRLLARGPMLGLQGARASVGSAGPQEGQRARPSAPAPDPGLAVASSGPGPQQGPTATAGGSACWAWRAWAWGAAAAVAAASQKGRTGGGPLSLRGAANSCGHRLHLLRHRLLHPHSSPSPPIFTTSSSSFSLVFLPIHHPPHPPPLAA